MVFKWDIRHPLTSKWWPPQWHWKHLTTLFPIMQRVSVMVHWFDSNEFFFLFLFYLFSLEIVFACKIWKVSCIYSLYQIWSSFFWLLFILFWIIFYWFFKKILSPNIWFHLIFTSNLVFILFTAICFLIDFYFQFHLSTFCFILFYVKLDLHYFNCYFLFFAFNHF
jgi:hypothetical protein